MIGARIVLRVGSQLMKGQLQVQSAPLAAGNLKVYYNIFVFIHTQIYSLHKNTVKSIIPFNKLDLAVVGLFLF